MFGKKEGSIKDLEKDTQKAIDWIAAEYKYLKELEKDLANIENMKISHSLTFEEWEAYGEKLQSIQKDIKKARRVFRYISKAGKRAEKEIKIVIEDLKIFIDKYPQLANVEKGIEISSEKLIKAFSFYTGDFRKNLFSLILASRKMEKDILKKKTEKVKEDDIIIKQIVSQTKEYIDNIIEWLKALEISLEKAEEIEEKLEIQEKGIQRKLEPKEGYEIIDGWYVNLTILSRWRNIIKDNFERIKKGKVPLVKLLSEANNIRHDKGIEKSNSISDLSDEEIKEAEASSDKFFKEQFRKGGVLTFFEHRLVGSGYTLTPNPFVSLAAYISGNPHHKRRKPTVGRLKRGHFYLGDRLKKLLETKTLEGQHSVRDPYNFDDFEVFKVRINFETEESWIDLM